MLRHDVYLRNGAMVSKGCYWVHHYAHRESHLVRIEKGTFPTCNRCGERVRFEPALRHEGGLVWDNPDFRAEAS